MSPVWADEVKLLVVMQRPGVDQNRNGPPPRLHGTVHRRAVHGDTVSQVGTPTSSVCTEPNDGRPAVLVLFSAR